MKHILHDKRTVLAVGLVLLWALIGVLWVASPGRFLVGYMRYQLNRDDGLSQSLDNTEQDASRRDIAFVSVVRNGSRQPIQVRHKATGIKHANVFSRGTGSEKEESNGFSADGIIHADGQPVRVGGINSIVVVGEAIESAPESGAAEIRTFPSLLAQSSVSNLGTRELPDAVVVSYGEAVLLCLVAMVIAFSLPHPGPFLGRLLVQRLLWLAELVPLPWRVTTGLEAGVAKKHVFMSYCHSDKKTVALVAEGLRDRGEAVWWDKDILPGEDWKLAIRRAIRESHAVVVILSENLDGRSKSGVYPEILYAINLLREYAPGSIYLIPVRLSPCEVPPFEIDANRTLDSLQWIDLFPPRRFEKGLDRLAEAIRKAPDRPD